MKRLLVAVLLALALVATVCGDDDSTETSDTTVESSDTTATDATDTTAAVSDVPAGATVVSVGEDTTTKPEIELEPSDEAPTEVIIDDVVEGDGEEVQPHAEVSVQYVGVLTDGTEFDASWDRGEPITFSLDGVIQGWGEGLVGMKVGGRRVLVIPSDLAYGDNPQPGSPIPAGAALVFVVDMLSVTNPAPAGVTVTNVTADLGAEPEFDLEGSDEAPTELASEDVVEGDGDEVTEGDTVEVKYVGVLTDGTQFDATWGSEQETLEIALDGVIPGWSEGLVGMKVGGRRLLVIPPDLGYGPGGSGGVIPPNATLVFVVDLVSVSGGDSGADSGGE